MKQTATFYTIRDRPAKQNGGQALYFISLANKLQFQAIYALLSGLCLKAERGDITLDEAGEIFDIEERRVRTIL